MYLYNIKIKGFSIYPTYVYVIAILFHCLHIMHSIL